MKYWLSIFWFRQDLRIHDNRGLYFCIEQSRQVLPIFVFDDNILKNFPNKDNRLGFLVSALQSLDSKLKNIWWNLHIRKWNPEEVFLKFFKKYKIDAIFTNRSYWPYGSKRDFLIAKLCKQYGIDFNVYDDFLLVEPEQVSPTKVFTPYFKKWQKIDKKEMLPEPKNIDCPKIYIKPRIQIIKYLNYDKIFFWDINFTDQRLKNFNFSNYEDTRNLPYLDWSSRLSPYIRFWIISIRQLYHKVRASDNVWAQTFVSQLAWRDFWNHIFINFPETYFLEFQTKKRDIAWQNNEKLFESWKNWMTWYPIVDAGMRQLKQENRMHNRVRMITSSFLTKDLLIDRRRWERHFANYLLDYDSNLNTWNWQWAASVGADPKPLRIFNPVLQAKRFDSHCEYIKKYIPELRNINAKQILDPLNNNLWYAAPVVNHYERSKLAKTLYYNIN